MIIDITPADDERIAVWPGETQYARRTGFSLSRGRLKPALRFVRLQ
jgi:hypothetical protein